jgi:hypothetical protein
MTHSRLFQLLSIPATLLISACAADPGPRPDNSSASDDGTAVHMLRVRTSSEGTAASAVAPRIAGLTYFGGPLLRTVDVHPVFWNSAVKLQANLNAFYCAIVTCPLFSMLAQYNIGFGTCHAGIVDTKATASVRDSAVQAEISALITAGRLPAPNANTYYPVHFPSGMTITAPDGSRSCVQFCAYHGTFVRAGVNVNYGVIPDIGQSGCAGGCGGSTVTNNTDSVASHELIEAVTDPAVGLATVFGPPLGWYDQPDNQEIGDLCNAQQGTSCGFTVQKEWSNAAGACVDH